MKYTVMKVGDAGSEQLLEAFDSEHAATKYGRLIWADVIAAGLSDRPDVHVAVEPATADGRREWSSKGPEVFALSLQVQVVARWDRHAVRPTL